MTSTILKVYRVYVNKMNTIIAHTFPYEKKKRMKQNTTINNMPQVKEEISKVTWANSKLNFLDFFYKHHISQGGE